MNNFESLAWWSNLSINQMKEIRKKYAPNISWEVFVNGYKWIEDAWNQEGQPEPQALIPLIAIPTGTGKMPIQRRLYLTDWQLRHLKHKFAAFQFWNLNATAVTSWLGIIDQRDWEATNEAFPPEAGFYCYSIMVGL